MFSNLFRKLIKSAYKNMFFYKNSHFLNSLSPIEKYSQLTAFDAYSGVYEYWRVRRITKILSLFELDELKKFRILELGAGNCEMGAFFADLGCQVVCLEGRKESVIKAKLRWKNLDNLTIYNANLEESFSHYGHFDLIINFGLIYHLKDIEQHLECCASMSNNLILESLILDSSENICQYVHENLNHTTQSLIGVGSRPTASYIETRFHSMGFSVTQLFDADLNSGPYVYDWKPLNDGKVKHCHYRMWVFKK